MSETSQPGLPVNSPLFGIQRVWYQAGSPVDHRKYNEIVMISMTKGYISSSRFFQNPIFLSQTIFFILFMMFPYFSELNNSLPCFIMIFPNLPSTLHENLCFPMFSCTFWKKKTGSITIASGFSHRNLIQGLEDAGIRGDVRPFPQCMEVLHLPFSRRGAGIDF